MRKLRPAKPSTEGNRRTQALRRLGVTAAEVAKAPDITTMLKRGAGGLERALEAMRFSMDLSVIAFLEKHDEIGSRDRKSLTWEAIALAAGVDLTHLLGGIILAIQAHSASEVKILALTNHPDTMRARIAAARLTGGTKDRDALDTGLGFLPTAKGSTFIINPQTSKADKDDDDDEGIDAPEGDLDHLFPSLSKTQEALVPARSRMLDAGN